LAAGAAVWPFAARAQRPAVPVIGFLSSASRAPFEHLVGAFRQGLGETVYRNATIEYCWADNQYERLPAMAAELVERRVAVIVASGGNIAAVAANCRLDRDLKKKSALESATRRQRRPIPPCLGNAAAKLRLER
jgi:hypothetical protein